MGCLFWVCIWHQKPFLNPLLEEQLTVDSDDEYEYEEVPVDEDFITAGL